MVSIWEFATTFAGPIATVVASVTAVGVTAYFGRKQLQIAASQATTAASQAATAATQKEIAKSQRDIAYDRLKYDLFQKRYEIYLAAKTLIELTSKLDESKDMFDQRAELKVKLIEARFFYPPAEVALFEDIAQLAAKHRIASTTPFAQNERPELRAEAENIATNSLMKLAEIYERLPDLLSRELAFAQLTSRELS